MPLPCVCPCEEVGAESGVGGGGGGKCGYAPRNVRVHQSVFVRCVAAKASPPDIHTATNPPTTPPAHMYEQSVDEAREYEQWGAHTHVGELRKQLLYMARSAAVSGMPCKQCSSFVYCSSLFVLSLV